MALSPRNLLITRPLNSGLLLRLQQLRRAVEGGEHAPPVDVAPQQHRGVRFGRHAHVDDVVLVQVDLRRAPGPLDHDDVVLRRQGAVGRQNIGNQAASWRKVVPGRSYSPGPPHSQSPGTHIAAVGLSRMGFMRTEGLRPRRFGLHHLGPSHLQSLRRNVGVEGHVLGLKGGHPVAVLGKNPAQRRRQKLFPALEVVP